MTKILIREVEKSSKVEILGHVFNGLDDMRKAVEMYCRIGREAWPTEPSAPVEGVHVACVYEPYPCFDSEDYCNEDRDYRNFFFSTKKFTEKDVERLSKLPGRCNAQIVNEDMPEWAVPAVYYPGDGATMIVATPVEETKFTTETHTTVSVNIGADEDTQNMEKVTPKGKGKLDMVIAFDTTGSMAEYIDDVRRQVAEMIPRLFKDNEDLRLGIVAFGDYCDMESRDTFGKAYQCIPLTDNENAIIKFVRESQNTAGGDGDEFYELVLKKIIEESPWREDSSKAILLIADADPHDIGYTYRDYVVGNQIDWKEEARKAAEMMIKIDTVSICGRQWYKELSDMTNGISVPFKSSGKTGVMIETATTARSAMAFAESARRSDDKATRAYCTSRIGELRKRMSFLTSEDPDDEEMNGIWESYSKEIDETDETPLK